MKNTDAWAQLSALYEKYTKEWLVRSDLRVRALGTSRVVELGLGELHGAGERRDGRDRPRMVFHVTQRNVGTMREMAAALVEACDFVDQANPKWAADASAHRKAAT